MGFTRACLVAVLVCFPATNTVSARVLPSFDARMPPAEQPRPATLPDDSELERAGARIGAIEINALQLFDATRNDQRSALGSLANRLHVETRIATIRDQLLFHSGDPYRARALAESARILRDTRYLRDAVVCPIAYHDGVVDVLVTTQDVWTFNPGVSFGRRGGRNSTGVELEDLNFLGRGTQLGVAFKSDVDRDSTSIRYRDRQVGSSWWDLAAGYSDNSDGRLAEFGFDHPFYSLDSRWAAGVSMRDDRRVDSRYDRGAIVDRYATKQRDWTLYWGRSSGLVDGWARRITTGLSYESAAFDAPSGSRVRLLPADRRLVYPWLAAEWLQDDFRTGRNRDQIEKTEDYSLGWRMRAQLGFAATALDSDRNAWLFAVQASKGAAPAEGHTLMFDADASGRVERGLRDGRLGVRARYYFQQSPRRLLFVSLAGEAGSRLDADRQILLGGDSGLRGYPLRYQAGTSRVLLSAEQRFFTNWYPFQLFNVGAAVFCDMGATFGRDPLGSPSRGLLRDLGVGLRLGNSRSALGNVLHVDLAVPLDGDPSMRKVQLLVETRKSF